MALGDRMDSMEHWLRTGVVAALALGWSAGSAGATGDFAAWVGELRHEAAGRGVSASVLDAALDGVAPLPRVIELDRKQPESTITFEQYLDRVVTSARVRRGRALYAEHRTVLEEIGRRYGVQPRFVVALWGIETDFGRNTGGFDVVAALATLAYDGRRSAYFRSELLDALEILEEGHIRPQEMKGSWAGAMGQCQFMPSSFRRYAVDANDDGRRDIWSTLPDVFASTANYLGQVGWNPRFTWGREVRLPKGFDAALAGLDTRRPLDAWQRLGVRAADGSDLPDVDTDGALVLPDGRQGRAFLVYDNYRSIMKWNRSLYFATAVGLLADRIGSRAGS